MTESTFEYIARLRNEISKDQEILSSGNLARDKAHALMVSINERAELKRCLMMNTLTSGGCYRGFDND